MESSEEEEAESSSISHDIEVGILLFSCVSINSVWCTVV